MCECQGHGRVIVSVWAHYGIHRHVLALTHRVYYTRVRWTGIDFWDRRLLYVMWFICTVYALLDIGRNHLEIGSFIGARHGRAMLPSLPNRPTPCLRCGCKVGRGAPCHADDEIRPAGHQNPNNLEVIDPSQKGDGSPTRTRMFAHFRGARVWLTGGSITK